MRDITRDIVTAFIRGEERQIRNSYTDGRVLRLFGTTIAWRDPDGSYRVTCAGYSTRTTLERINGFCEILNKTHPFHIKKGQLYYCDRAISSDEIIRVHPP